MTIKINFDTAHNPEVPTLVLAKKNGDMLGKINAKSIEVSGSLNDANEITFNVHKHIDGKEDLLWDEILNFRLVYCVEWNQFFEITVEVDESNETVKTVFCTQLGQAELGQIMLYDIEINTEIDISREGYDKDYPTVLYRDITNATVEELEKLRDSSLLHRIMEKAPHYSVVHVDNSIANIQREFTFNETSLYDAFQDIAEEIHCIFIFDVYLDGDGNIKRTISVYDLESRCLNKECGYRGEFSDVCPKCERTDIEYYGEDTTIFVTSDEIADSIQLTTDTGAVKNCFKLEAGDPLMTATIRNCNPNGSDYIWYLPDYMKRDMSEKLVGRIEEYDNLYDEYQNKHEYILSGGKVFVTDLDQIETISLDSTYVNKRLNVEVYVSNSCVVDKLGNVSLSNPKLATFYYVSKMDYIRSKYILFNDSVYFVPMDSSIREVSVGGDNGKKVVISCRKVIAQEVDLVTAYNNLATKYHDYNNDLKAIPEKITGFPALMDVYYDSIDFELFLRSALMPNVDISKNITKEAENLTADALSPVSTDNEIKNISVQTANNIVLSMAKVLVDSRFKIKIAEDSSLSAYTEGDIERIWKGKFILTDETITDEEAEENEELIKTVTTDIIEIHINDDFETFVKQKLEKSLSKGDSEDMSISGLFKKNGAEFEAELKNYCLNRLSSFYDACQACLDILVEQGVADGETWGDRSLTENISNLYDDLYIPYRNKMRAINAEMIVRENELAIIGGAYDENGELKTYGVKNCIEDEKNRVQNILDFQKFISDTITDIEGNRVYDGSKYWNEFCSFRREDKYSNNNYISDGLNNAEVISKAKEFIEVATKEIYKSAEMQKSISASLKNLLVIKKFEPLVNSFALGNFLRVQIDNEVYKLRLISYDIDYENIANISVEFSDTVKVSSSVSDVQDILEQASSMATSYSTVMRQASQGEKGNAKLDGWVNDGLALTKMKIIDNADNQNITWDEHGLLCREYLPVTDDYDDRQLKIINRGLYVTNDGWETSKAGIGNFTFYNPKTQQEEDAYGVIADTLVGNLILSEEVGIYNKDSSISLDKDGLTMTVDRTSNVENNIAFTIQTKSMDDNDNEILDKVMYVDADGNFCLSGNVRIGGSGGGSSSSLGKTVSSTDEQFYLSNSRDTLSPTPSDSDWKSEYSWENGKYIWRRLKIVYHDSSVEYSPSATGICISGGDGSNGNGIESVTNYYLATSWSSGVGVGNDDWGTWSTDVSEQQQKLSETNKYLWNYEKVVYTLSGEQNTTPCVIHTYSVDGRGIVSIEEYYAVSETTSPVPTEWVSSAEEANKKLNEKYKFLWNYEVINYTVGEPTVTDPAIIGAHGNSIDYITRYFRKSSTMPSEPPKQNPPEQISGIPNDEQWTADEPDDFDPSDPDNENVKLYYVDLTVMKDGSWFYSAVTLASSFEVAKKSARTATNYIYTSVKEGLIVSNMENINPSDIDNDRDSVDLGYHTAMRNDGFHIKNDKTNLASFEADKLQLGLNTDSKVVIDNEDGLQFFNGDNVDSSFNDGSIVLGATTNSKVTIDGTDGLRIYNEDKISASFNSNIINLGQDSTDAQIKLCGEKGMISYGKVYYGYENSLSTDSDCVTISGDNIVLISDDSTEIINTAESKREDETTYATYCSRGSFSGFDINFGITFTSETRYRTSGFGIGIDSISGYVDEGNIGFTVGHGDIEFITSGTMGVISLNSSRVECSNVLTAGGNFSVGGDFYFQNEGSSIVSKWGDTSYQVLTTNDSSLSLSRSGITTVLRGDTVRLGSASGTQVTSDERLKEGFVTLNQWEDFYDSLEPCAFKMKNGKSGRYHIGFKAQQVENALTDNGLTTSDFAGFVRTTYVPNTEDPYDCEVYEQIGINEGDDEYGLIYTEFVALNTYNIQKLKTENKELKSKISDLESKLERIENSLNANNIA